MLGTMYILSDITMEVKTMWNKDQIYCTNCGIIKNRAFVPDRNGLDLETIENETKTAKCCDKPHYFWVCLNVATGRM